MAFQSGSIVLLNHQPSEGRQAILLIHPAIGERQRTILTRNEALLNERSQYVIIRLSPTEDGDQTA
jgi:hypothetical protein